MKRIDINNEKAPNFIGCWFLEEKNISKGIIDFFENNQSLPKKGSTADPAPTYRAGSANKAAFAERQQGKYRRSTLASPSK